MKTRQNPVFVTQPSLPNLEEYQALLQKIWNSKILTNKGSFLIEFEKALSEYLGIEWVSVFSNGTLSLLSALQALNISGEVITTPFSFVATTHALWWNGLTPVFADIDPEYFTLDPEAIEKAITPQTTAILPVHVYGNPCRMDEIRKIAQRHNLKVIYDAAHTFGVEKDGKSILEYGDLSILSFHATKVFNTIEGGAIVSHDPQMKRHIDHLKNFGFEDEVTVVEPGINAKMNELQAAYGLLQLKTIDDCIARRRVITTTYREILESIPGISCLTDIPGVKHNYAYFPILIDRKAYGSSRDTLYEKLKEHNIYGRRYFYPLISAFPPYKELNSAKKENLPVANLISEQVLCLPIYPDLEISTVEYIAELIKHYADN